jgi:hypothetical protein
LLWQGVPWSNPDCPVLFINVNGGEARADGRSGGGGGDGEGGGASYHNLDEADTVLRALQRLLAQHDDTVHSVALLSPYRQAVAEGMLRQCL